MSDVVASGEIEAGRFEAWAKTFHSRVSGMDSALIQEAKVHFNDGGLSVTAADAADVAMFGDTTLSPEAFASYDAEGAATIGVAFEKLIDFLGTAAASDTVTFEVDMETRTFGLSYGQTDLSMSLIDPDAMRNEPDTPALDLPNTVVLEGAQLTHATDVADMMTDHITIFGDAEDDAIRFVAEGDTDDATVRYDAEGITEHAKTILSLNYLACFAKPMPDDAEVSIHFDTEFPVRLDWSMFGGAFDVCQILAPRIEGN